MEKLPETFIRIAATGSNQNTRDMLAQEKTAFTNDANSPEKNLLLSVVAHVIQNQAGYIPEKLTEPLAEASAKETRQICTVKAQYHLILMLNGLYDNFLPLWFEKIAENNQTIPYEMIPKLLDYGARKRSLAPYIREALGDRGRWLVENIDNRRWRWFNAQGNKKEAIQNRYESWANHLKNMRQSDPEGMIKILTESWSQLDTIMQSRLLVMMEDDLSQEDIPFLLSCLEHSVLRPIAFKLLMRIEESDINAEIRQKIKHLIVLEQDNQSGNWTINFVHSPLEAYHSDETSPDIQAIYQIKGYSISPEAILMLLPLSYWYEDYGVTPNNLITAAKNSAYPEVFYRIWESIAIDANDTQFLYQLMLHVSHYATSRLMKHLSQEQLMQLAIVRLKAKPLFSVSHSGVKILKVIKTIWNDELTMAFLKSLENAFKEIPRPMLDKKMREELLKYAEWIPLSFYNHFEQVIHTNARGNLSEAETEQINGVMSIIKFRVELLDAIETGNY